MTKELKLAIFGLGAVLGYVFYEHNEGGAVISIDGVPQDPFTVWDSDIQNYSAQNNIPWRWMKAIMMNESNLGQASSVAEGLADPSDVDGSKSSDGKSWGLMQLTIPTAQMYDSTIDAEGLNDPQRSMSIGAQYIAYLYRLKDGDQENTVRSYNGGPGWAGTAQGPNATQTYYNRFLSNLATIMSKQPGDANEV